MMTESQLGILILFNVFLVWFQPGHKLLMLVMVLSVLIGKLGELTGLVVYSSLFYMLIISLQKK